MGMVPDNSTIEGQMSVPGCDRGGNPAYTGRLITAVECCANTVRNCMDDVRSPSSTAVVAPAPRQHLLRRLHGALAPWWRLHVQRFLDELDHELVHRADRAPHSADQDHRSEEHTSELQSRGHLVC